MDGLTTGERADGEAKRTRTANEPGRVRINGRRPIRFGAAARAMQKLLADPDDTAQVFTIIEALSGNSGDRSLRKFRRTPVGAAVLAERRNLLAALKDRERLRALPENSLGRAYLAFLESENITAEGLVGASETGSMRRAQKLDVGPDMELFGDRMRDMHDLWHTVTGYKGDLIGEAAMLAFSFAQTWNPGVGFIVSIALLRMARFRAVSAQRVVVEAFARGIRAKWLPAADWEALLPMPLEEVRRRLRVGKPPAYTPIRSSMLKQGVAEL